MGSDESENLYSDVSLVERAPNRKKILEKLNNSDNVFTPSELARELEIYRQNVSRSIQELEEKNLVNCLAPEANKFRYYEITERGKNVLGIIEER